MQRKGTILLPVLIGLSVISLLASAGLFYLYQKEYAQNIKLQGQIVELDTLQRKTAGKLEESKKIATDLTLKLQEAKTKMDALSTDLTAEKVAHAQTASKLDQFKADLTQQKTLREDLESRLKQVQEDGKKIKEQIKIMQQQKIALDEKIRNLESGATGVELGKVVVNPELLKLANDSVPARPKPADKPKPTDKVIIVPEAKAVQVEKKVEKIAEPAPLSKRLEGKVIIVNKEFNFVVINLGSRDKIKVNDEFLVSRAGTPIGDIKVEKVHEAMSAAGFAAELNGLINENDKVTQKIK